MDENVSIIGASLTDSSSLSLELIPTCEEHKILQLKYCVVYGNDRHPKHNPTMPGRRSQEYHIEVSSSTTVKSLKYQFLHHYRANMSAADANLESHQTAYVDIEKRIENLRVRLTNWAGECGELMEELNDESKESYEYTLAEISFNPAYLLLLEEGKYPLKGILYVKVYFHIC